MTRSDDLPLSSDTVQDICAKKVKKMRVLDVLIRTPMFSALERVECETLSASAGFLNWQGTIEKFPEEVPADTQLFDVGDTAEFVYILASSNRAESEPYARIEFPLSPPAKPIRYHRISQYELFGELELHLDGFDASRLENSGSARGNHRLRRSTRCRLLSDAFVVAIPVANFLASLHSREHFFSETLRVSANRLNQALQSSARKSELGASVALADYLMATAESCGSFKGSYVLFKDAPTQDHLAAELGLSRRTVSDELGQLIRRGIVDRSPFAIRDIDRLDLISRSGSASPNELIRQYKSRIRQSLDAGDLLRAYVIAQDALLQFPSEPETGFLAALALNRSGNSHGSNTLLKNCNLLIQENDALVERILFGILAPTSPNRTIVPNRDDLIDLVDENFEPNGPANWETAIHMARALASEIIGLAGSIEKKNAEMSSANKTYRKAAHFYRRSQSLSGPGVVFGAINEMYLLAAAGDQLEANEVAQKIVRDAGNSDYWELISTAEAHLFLGTVETAEKYCKRAVALAPSDAAIASTRRQLVQYAKFLKGDADRLLSLLTVNRPLIYSGTMIKPKQFDDPSVVEDYVAAEIDKFLETHEFSSAFGSLARGSDIIIAEKLLEYGVSLSVVLPFHLDQFVDNSVDMGFEDGAHWVQRFESVLKQCDQVKIAQSVSPSARDIDYYFQHSFKTAASLALERGDFLQTEALLLAISAEGPSGQIAGTNVDVNFWKTQSDELIEVHVPFPKYQASGPSKPAHGFRPLVQFLAKGKDTDFSEVRSLISILDDSIEGIFERKTKDKRNGIAIVLDGIQPTLKLLSKFMETGQSLQAFCGFGPALNKRGEVDTNLVSSQLSVAGLHEFSGNAIMASGAFVHELRFSNPQHSANSSGPRSQVTPISSSIDSDLYHLRFGVL